MSVNNVMAMYVSPDYDVPQGLMLGPGSSDVSAVYTSDRVELVRGFCLLIHVNVDDLQYIVI